MELGAFINRAQELAQLRDAAANPPALVIIRGRRRVGKSFLLRAALAGDRVIIVQADEQSERQQLAAFAREASRVLLGAPGLRFATWDEALELLAAQATERPLVVLLDEFQHMGAAQPALASILQRHWDDWQRRGVPITLVLCGSALSFMEGLLPAHAPLAGRATLRPVITPMGYRDAAKFAASGTSPQRLIERFAVVGGTPQYQVWAGHRDLRAMIREVILTKGAPLYEEPIQLLRTEEAIRDAGRYLGVLTAVAAGHTQINEMAQHTGHDASNVLKALQRLRDLQYIELREPVALDRPRKVRPFWRISDPFFRFWFRWVHPNRSRLEWGLVEDVLADVERDLDSHTGIVFEDCCREWLVRSSGLEEMRNLKTIGNWWRNDPAAEIDIVVVDKSRYVLLGSCKWQRGRVGAAVLDALYDHRALLGAKAARARLVIFARDGFRDDVQERADREGVLLRTAENLFAP